MILQANPFLTKTEKLALNDNGPGKVEGIQLMIGRKPYAAFGNTSGDQQMLEYTKSGSGPDWRCSLCMMTPQGNMHMDLHRVFPTPK